jgi:predicted PurR-regulated permease PerM
MTAPQARHEYLRIAIAMLMVAALLGASVWVLKPFLPALVWSTMVVIATWELMLGVQRRLWGRRWAAVTVMVIALLLVLVIPLTLAIFTVVENADRLAGWYRTLAENGLPQPPEFVASLPLFGEKLAHEWKLLADAGPQGLLARAQPYFDRVLRWVVGEVGAVGAVLMHFLLTVVISALFYGYGEHAAESVRRVMRRIGGDRADRATVLAAQAVRAVALGIVVTALVQSAIGGLGLAFTGIPQPTLLTALMFMFAVAQLGVFPVLVPCVVWLYWSGDTGWGTALLVVTVIAGGVDNFLRPLLIRRGADLPLVLIFAGVLGGLFAFGIIGLFIGPVVLAVTYTLMGEWVRDAEPPAPTGGGA